MAYAAGLGRAFGFDAADLTANRQGRLSAEQALIFANAARYGRRRSAVVLPIFAVLLLGTVVLAVATTASSDLVPVLAVVGGMGTFLVVLVAVFSAKAARDRAVQAAGRVFWIEGPWELDPSLDGTWRVRIGEAHFGVELLQYEALDEDATYRAYFLPTMPTATLLSIERA